MSSTKTDRKHRTEGEVGYGKPPAEHRFKPGQITETLLNDYMALVRPKKQAAAE